MSVSIKLGTYTFGNEITEFEIENESRVEQVAIPRRNGLRSDAAYVAGLRIRLSGLISETLDTEARAALNSLKNAFNQGKVNLTLYDDRQVEVQKTFFSYRYVDGDLRTIEWDAEVVADDYGFVAVNQTADERTIGASPEEEIFVNNGNLPTDPVIRISAIMADIASGVRIDNLTQSAFFTYNSLIPSSGYVDIDTANLTVTDHNGSSQFGNFQGNFFNLSPLSNVLQWTGSYGNHKLKLTYRDKYDGA